MIDKQALLKAITAHFEHEYDTLAKAAKANYDAATHEDSKAENKYDTRGLEASYIAGAQSKRAKEMAQTVGIYRKMEARVFKADEPIVIGALVTLEDEKGRVSYFLGPQGGGSKITFEAREITIVTAASPLGKSLLGSELDDEIKVGPRTYEIVAID